MCLLVPHTIRADLEPKKAVVKKSPAITAAVATESRRAELAKDFAKLLENQVIKLSVPQED